MATGDTTDTLTTRVRSRIGEPSKQGINDEEIWAYLSYAQRDLAMRLNEAAIPELTPVTESTLTNSRAAVPSSPELQRIRLLQVGANNIPARRWPVVWRDALTDNAHINPSAAEPYYWLWYDSDDGAVRLNVEIDDATSTAAYRLHYVETPDDVYGSASGDAADPSLHERWHGLMVDLAVALARSAKGEWGEYDRVRRKYLARARTQNSRYSATGMRPVDAESGDVGG